MERRRLKQGQKLGLMMVGVGGVGVVNSGLKGKAAGSICREGMKSQSSGQVLFTG